jgi:thymidylate synthase (FAD)
MNDNKPHAKLISAPDNILKTIYTACRTCYSADSPQNIFDNADDETKMLKLVKKVMSSGHLSTIEHIQVSFAVSNISRSCSHQLVRHRHMSFSQKSQRYVKENQFEYLIPQTINSNEELKEKFVSFMEEISKTYNDFIEAGIPAEDARAVLPNACATSMIVSTNLRELIHVANLRLCSRAQTEIRLLIKAMCDELIAKEAWLKDYLVPKCETNGFCDEDKSCGRKSRLNLKEETE